MSNAPTHGHNMGQDQSSTAAIARETNTPIEEVEEIYAAEVAALENTARIKTYVEVIATSRTRVATRQRARNHP